MSTVEANTIAIKDKKAFEVFLEALVAQDVTDEDQFEKIYDVYNEKFQKRMAGRQLDELLLNAVEHLAKQGMGHKWMLGDQEGQLENFNKEGFERLLKLNPSLKKVWDSRHTEDSKMFLPENSALAEAEKFSKEEIANTALEAYETRVDSYDADVEEGQFVDLSKPISDCVDEVLGDLDIDSETYMLIENAVTEYEDMKNNPYHQPSREDKVREIVKMMKKTSEAEFDYLADAVLEDVESEDELDAIAKAMLKF